MTNQQKDRLSELQKKHLAMVTDAELARQVKKCPNKWFWSAQEIEMASREAKKYEKIFTKT